MDILNRIKSVCLLMILEGLVCSFAADVQADDWMINEDYKQLDSRGATDFEILLKGDVASQITGGGFTDVTNAFANPTRSTSKDAFGNTVVRFTGTSRIPQNATADRHFGIYGNGTKPTVWQKAWSFDTAPTRVPVPKSNFAFSYEPSTNMLQFIIENTSSETVTFQDVGFLFNSTEIPIDFLNRRMMPPSIFNPLPRLSHEYAPGQSDMVEFSHVDPSLFIITYATVFFSGASASNDYNVTGGEWAEVAVASQINELPVAVCQDVVVEADANCTASASVDGGSFDPDGDSITLTQDPPGPYRLGQTQVALIVSDGLIEDSCMATVTVVDTTSPELACALLPGMNPGAKNTPNASAGFRKVFVTATDNCDIVSLSCSIDGVLVSDGDLVKITVASGQGGGKITSTAGGMKHIVGPTGILTCVVTDTSGNQAVCQATPVGKGAIEELKKELRSLVKEIRGLRTELRKSLVGQGGGIVATQEQDLEGAIKDLDDAIKELDKAIKLLDDLEKKKDDPIRLLDQIEQALRNALQKLRDAQAKGVNSTLQDIIDRLADIVRNLR